MCQCGKKKMKVLDGNCSVLICMPSDNRRVVLSRNEEAVKAHFAWLNRTGRGEWAAI